MFDAATILAIPDDAPERLFRGAATEVAKQYRTLTMRWHPDRPDNHGSAEAKQVFQKITSLKQAAEERIEARDWFLAPGEVELEAKDGRTHRLPYRAHRAFDLGHMLIGLDSVAYLIRQSNADLAANARRAINSITFANDAMRTEFACQLPRIKEAFETNQYHVLILDKDPEAVLLADLLAHLGGKFPARHVAWVMSRSLNLACWLGWAKRFHGDVSAASLFVNPRLHSASLLGGWWYSVPVGARMVALPRRTADLLPSDVLRSRQGDVRGDLEAVRALCRELFGDPAGTRLRRDAEVPSVIAEWALQAGSSSAVTDFQAWPGVLHRAFGPRRFVELPVTFDEIYSLPST